MDQQPPPPSPSVSSTSTGAGKSRTEKEMRRGLKPNKWLYVFYEHSGANEILSYSLYKVGINLEKKLSRSPLLVKGFERAKFPAQGMKCAQLGSKLYFLGGSYQESYERVHPLDVHVLDVTTDKLEKMKATLNTGKPHPCAVFAVNGKLYAIGTIIHDPYYNPPTLSPLECFDMNTMEWKVVDKRPRSKGKSIFWVGCTVLEKRQKVVLVGSESPMSNYALVKFIYYVTKDKWTRHPIFRYEGGPLTLGFHEGDDQDYLYGIDCLGQPLKSKTGCISWSQENALFNGGNVDGLIKMSIDDDATTPELKTQAFHQPYLYSSTTVRHLGSDYFCYITSGSNSPGIATTLFKEEEKHSFKINILDFKSYITQTCPGEAHAELVECFVVSTTV